MFWRIFEQSLKLPQQYNIKNPFSLPTLFGLYNVLYIDEKENGEMNLSTMLVILYMFIGQVC